MFGHYKLAPDSWHFGRKIHGNAKKKDNGSFIKKMYFDLDHAEKFGFCMMFSISQIMSLDVVEFWPLLLNF